MNIYQSFYDLINQYVFGNSIVVGSHQDLVTVLMSTIAVIFVVALPFMLVWKVIKML